MKCLYFDEVITISRCYRKSGWFKLCAKNSKTDGKSGVKKYLSRPGVVKSDLMGSK
jgi:hypothetical protein